MTNDVPIRYQTNLSKRNKDDKRSMVILDNRYINEPIEDSLDMNNNKIIMKKKIKKII